MDWKLSGGENYPIDEGKKRGDPKSGLREDSKGRMDRRDEMSQVKEKHSVSKPRRQRLSDLSRQDGLELRKQLASIAKLPEVQPEFSSCCFKYSLVPNYIHVSLTDQDNSDHYTLLISPTNVSVKE